MQSVSSAPLPSLPGFSPIPLIGSRLDLIRFFNNPVGIMQKLYQDYGTIASMTKGDPSMVCAFGPQFNQQVLSNAKAFHNFADLPIKLPEDSAAARFNTNLTAQNGDIHRTQRRLMMPAFHKKTVDSYHADMVDVAKKHLATWPRSGKIDIKKEMTELTLSVMMKSLFGLEVGDKASEFGHLAMEFLSQASSVGVMAFPFNLPGTPYRRFLKFCEHLESEFLNIINERRKKQTQAQDVLSIMIDTHDEDGNAFSNVELVGQTGLLFVAGHETTSFSLTWALFLLSQHPQIYADLLAELEPKLHGNAPTVEQLKELPLLDAVVKESMRLIPVVPFLFMRRGTSDFQLGPYAFPQDSILILSPLMTHHMADLYPEPKAFKPERWFNIKPSVFEYMPFGAGPRMCLGAGFASLEIRLVLAMIVQRYRLETLPNTKVDHKVNGITMGPKDVIPMRIMPQDGNFSAPHPVSGTIHELANLPRA